MIIINNIKFKFDHHEDNDDGAVVSHRVSGIGCNHLSNTIGWFKVHTNLDSPKKIDLINRTVEYYRFNNWFEKTCVGYWQYIDHDYFFFSNKEDVIKYYLGFY